jgi:hypothetical protein
MWMRRKAVAAAGDAAESDHGDTEGTEKGEITKAQWPRPMTDPAIWRWPLGFGYFPIFFFSVFSVPPWCNLPSPG